MLKKDCQYCLKREDIENFGRIAFETETSIIIAFKDQSHKGRMVVAYKNDHVAEIGDLSEEERKNFIDDVVKCANAIKKCYHPDRINYGAYGDALGHLHFHLVPKYKDGFEWGGTFVMNTGKENYCSEEELTELINNIKNNWE